MKKSGMMLGVVSACSASALLVGACSSSSAGDSGGALDGSADAPGVVADAAFDSAADVGAVGTRDASASADSSVDGGGDASADAASTALVGNVAAALGGVAAVAAASTVSTTSTGSRYDQLESFSPTPGEDDGTTLQMTFTSDVVLDLQGRGQTGSWNGTTSEVFPGTNPVWAETSEGEFGYTTGTETGFPPAYPGPMDSLQVAARWKQQAMENPAVLVQYALANPSAVGVENQIWNGATYAVLTIASPWGWPQPVRLFIDPATYLPVKSDTLEDDPVRGDSLYEVSFADWRAAGAVMAPFSVAQSLNGSTVQLENRTTVMTSATRDAGTFAVPSQYQTGFDPESASWGARSSQYFLRFQAFAYPLYFDQSVGVPPYVPGLRENVVVSTSGAQVVQYQFSYYNTMVVEMPTYLVVVEGPLYESASLAAIADIKTRFPGKPVKAVVSTHFHFDHTGGLRTYLATWPSADLYVPSEVTDFYAQLVAAPHTVQPDALSKTTWTGQILGVAGPEDGGTGGTPTVLTDGARTVRLFDIAVAHSKGHLIATVDDAQVVFTTDLYNPTANHLGGPLPNGEDRPAHDLYARELIVALHGLGYSPASSSALKIVGGHGGVGTWGELCVFGYGFGDAGAPELDSGTIDPAKVCP